MPVTTRSQAKLLELSTEFLEHTSLSSRPVQNCCSPSSSSSEHLDSSFTLHSSDSFVSVPVHRDGNFVSNGDHFEILEFQTYSVPLMATSSLHNFENSQYHPMESDFEQSSPATMASSNKSSSSPTMDSSNNLEIIQMLSAISSQMTSNYQALQDNMVKNDLRLSANFQNVAQEMDMFKQQVRAELDIFRNSLPSAQGSSSSNSNNVSLFVPSSPKNSSTLLPSTPQVTSAAGQNTSSPQEFQNQMMKMMTDTLSKLSIAVVDGKSADTKSDWLKFSGDLKTIKAWYFAILAQLSLSPWQELYDPGTNESF
jgi:hypothetical protein